MKNLANCNPIEFLSQSYKVISPAKELLTEAKVMEILKRKPKYKGNETSEEKESIYREKLKSNINDVLAELMQNKPEQTAKVLGLMCFIEPDDIGNHKGIELLMPAMELLANKEVLDFLFSLISSM